MSELYWIAKALKCIINNQREIAKNQRLILKQMEEFKTQLERLDKKIDERILVDFRSGMQHLLAGYNSDVEDVREEEFRMARDTFSRLMNLNPKEKTAGTSGEIGNPNLICMGYWGSVQYFSLQGDYRNALLHAYECTEWYPDIAARDLGLFPAELFSKDYTTLWRKAWVEFAEVTKVYDEHKARNKKEKAAFYAKQSLRAGAAGVVGAAGLGAAALVGYLTFGFAGGAAAAAGLHIAKKAWDSISVDPPDIHDVEKIESEIERLTTVLKDLPAELVKECQMRQTQLQRTTLKKLNRLFR